MYSQFNQNGYNGYPVSQNRLYTQNNFQLHTPPEKLYEMREKKAIRDTMLRIGGGLLLSYAVMFTIAIIFMMAAIPLGIMDLKSLNSDNTILNVINGIALIGCTLIGSAILCAFLKKSMSSLISVRPLAPSRFLLVVVSGFAVCMLANFLIELFIFLFGLMGVDIVGSLDDMTTVNTSATGYLYSYLCTAIIPALAEELMFRGVILGSLRKYGDGFAVLISALFFGLYHGNFVQAPFAVIVGLALGYVTVYTNSILPAMAIHFLNNAFAVTETLISSMVNTQISSIIIITSMLLIILWGIFSFITLAFDDKTFGRVTDNKNSVISLSKRVGIAISTPTVLIFIIMMLSSCILILFAY